MLEQYFFKPSTIDRLRGSWIATEIEAYVAWLAEQGYGAKTVWRRVPIGFAFGEFAWERGARLVADLPAHVEAFVAARVAAHHAIYSSRPMTKEVRGPVEQIPLPTALVSACAQITLLDASLEIAALDDRQLVGVLPPTSTHLPIPSVNPQLLIRISALWFR